MSLSIETIRKWVRMSPQTVSNCIQELQQAGLLKRLTKKNETGKYQLYPKPNGKPKPVHRRRKPKGEKRDNRDMKIDGHWRLSFNELWRVNVETCDIQTRRSRGKGVWRHLTLGDTIPKAIQRDFDLCTQAYHNLQNQLHEEFSESKMKQTPIRATTSSLEVHKTPTTQTDPSPDTFYQTIIDNNIFRPLGWRKPVSRPQFQLIATITGIKNAPPNAVILDKNTNTLHTLTIGETLGKETTLTDVKPKHVILRQNEKQTTLRLTNPFLR